MGRYLIKGFVKKFLDHVGRTREFIYACYSWIIFAIAAPATWFTLVVLPGERVRTMFVSSISRVVAKLVGIRLIIDGGEYLKGNQGAFVFVSNHASYLDAILLVGALPARVSFVTKAELKKNIILGFALSRLGVSFVERFDSEKGVADVQSLRDKTKKGTSLYFFAEGTFSRMPGLLPFRMGAFETAAKSGAKVVPVAIRGTRSILRANSWFPRRGVVRVLIGNPIYPEGQDDTWRMAVTLRDLTRKWILEHCGEPDLGREKSPLENMRGEI